MAKDKEFEILFQKYNMAVAKAQDLQEQLTTKQEQWQKRNEVFSVLEKNVRELCEDILAKDSKEMVLGTDYSWAETPVLQLISKSKKVFKEYNAKRTDTMRKIMDIAEERRDQIESLKEEIIQIKTRGNIKTSISREEIEEEVEKELEELKQKEKLKSSVKSMSPKVQQAYNKGEIEIKEIKNSLTNGEAFITNENDDLDFDDDEIINGAFVHKPKKTMKNKEQELREDAIKKNNVAKIMPKSIPQSESQKVIKDRIELNKKLNAEYSMNVLSEYEEKISDTGWILVEVIGTYGLSKGVDIVNKALELSAGNVKFTQSKFTNNLADLSNIGILDKEKISTPFSKMFIYKITSVGARIYKAKFNKDICISEADKIIAEHDNLTHGYSIKAVADLIKESNCYKDVEIWNRNKNKINISGGITYIPDIVCTGASGEHTYIEYERDNWTQKNFNTKLNKMLAVTPIINFITSDKAKAESIITKMVNWSKTKGNGGNMRHVILRVTTAKAIAGMNLSDNASWMYTFRPLKDDAPINNF